MLLLHSSLFLFLISINPSEQQSQKLINAVLQKYGPGATYDDAASFGFDLKSKQIIKWLEPWANTWAVKFHVKSNVDPTSGQFDLLNHLSLEVDKDNYGTANLSDPNINGHEWSRVPEALMDDGYIHVANSMYDFNYFSKHAPLKDHWYAVTICLARVKPKTVKFFFREHKVSFIYVLA